MSPVAKGIAIGFAAALVFVVVVGKLTHRTAAQMDADGVAALNAHIASAPFKYTPPPPPPAEVAKASEPDPPATSAPPVQPPPSTATQQALGSLGHAGDGVYLITLMDGTKCLALVGPSANSGRAVTCDWSR